MKYKDFSIKIGRRLDEGFAISVIASPLGEANDLITSTRELDEIFSGLRSLAHNLKNGGDQAQTVRPIDIGRSLFDILFVGRIRSLFDQSIGRVQGTGYGLRIKLHIDPENSDIARLASLPWELLYREETRDYLCLSSKTPLVRYLDVQRSFELLPFQPPLRVLVVVANPAGTKPLDLEKERESIRQSWGGKADVEVDFLDSATIPELRKRLAEAEYHVLHYMGHGAFDPRQGIGVLAMEKENGEMDLLDGKTLGILLRDETSIRLVFLNACDTGKLGHTTEQDPFAGVATALVMAGVPAVVAMQFPISDKAALAFAECFYPQLAKGVPVDASVAESRKAIRVTDRQSMEWAIPVLFMRSPSGHLFKSETAATGEPDKTGWTRAKTIGATLAAVAVLVGAFNFSVIRSWFLPADNDQQSTVNGTTPPDTGQPEDTGQPDGAGPVEAGEQTGAPETCGNFVALQSCDIPLARKICAAYAALESGDHTAAQPGDGLGSRRRNMLYTNEAENEAMTQFINNVRSAYRQAGGKGVEFVNFPDPLSFWRETPDASIVMEALINTAGSEIPDGVSNIFYDDDLPLSIDFEVEGNNWRSTRNYHAAAFYYYDAISAADDRSKRNSLDMAVSKITDRCSE